MEEIIINGDIMARFNAGSPDAPYTAAYGVSFNFSNDDQRNDMERFLFGSSLQYDVLNLTEQGSTPLDKLRSYIKRENVSDKHGFISWSTAISKNIENVEDSAVILISEYRFPHLARDIITFKRIPLQSVQRINVFRRTGQYNMCMKVLKEKRLESPIGPLYKYKVLSCELPKKSKLDAEVTGDIKHEEAEVVLPPHLVAVS